MLSMIYGSGHSIVIQMGTVLYASDDSDESIQEARAYIKKNRFTSDDVRLIQKSGSTLVVAKRLPEEWK